eukprot:TRINITY_DN960_c0_g2_i1.p1 TRINITY_DN960_c0_g2~~TRINITY_DN960_c0_g2_i1.p1  ORF type:complete len:188 (-),score=50.37 TRINITY_DN960_c0_g2_i1:111-674(-)
MVTPPVHIQYVRQFIVVLDSQEWVFDERKTAPTHAKVESRERRKQMEGLLEPDVAEEMELDDGDNGESRLAVDDSHGKVWEVSNSVVMDDEHVKAEELGMKESRLSMSLRDRAAIAKGWGQRIVAIMERRKDLEDSLSVKLQQNQLAVVRGVVSRPIRKHMFRVGCAKEFRSWKLLRAFLRGVCVKG